MTPLSGALRWRSTRRLPRDESALLLEETLKPAVDVHYFVHNCFSFVPVAYLKVSA